MEAGEPLRKSLHSAGGRMVAGPAARRTGRYGRWSGLPMQGEHSGGEDGETGGTVNEPPTPTGTMTAATSSTEPRRAAGSAQRDRRPSRAARRRSAARDRAS